MDVDYGNDNEGNNCSSPYTLRATPCQTTLQSCRRSSTHEDSVLVSGDGDNVRCCRLCGGENSLKFFKDTYVWEGVEEKYDQLLYDCFGVTVTSADCMICEYCIRDLRSMERFRALVHAAFDVTSDTDTATKVPSSVLTLIAHSCQTSASRHNLVNAAKQPQTIKKNIDRSKKVEDRKRRTRLEIKNIQKSNTWTRPETNTRRVNVPCSICNQKYPMVVSHEEVKYFVCSRCKKNGANRPPVIKKVNNPLSHKLAKVHTELHVKSDLRAKTRIHYQKKKLSPSPTIIITKETFQCTKCPMKYNLATHLALHVKNAHGDNNDYSGCKRENLLSCEKTQMGHLAPAKAVPCDEFKLLFHNTNVYNTDSTTNSNSALN